MDAVARARNLRVSHKDLQALGRFIQGDSADDAKAKLDRVTEKEQAVPYTRKNRDTPHRKDMAAGRYPVNAAEELRGVVHAAQANAEHQGADPDTVKISTVITNKGSNQMKPDRQRGRTMKLSHVTVKVTAQEEPLTTTAQDTQQQEEAEQEEAEAEEPEAEPEEETPSGEEQDSVDYTDLVDNTITDAKDKLQGLDDPDFAAALQAEKQGKDRSTFTAWLENQQDKEDVEEDGDDQ